MARIRERRCIATGQTLPESELIRFVVDPDNRVVADLDTRLPGRGAWVSVDRAAMDKAFSKGLFNRAFERAVTADPELPARIVDMLSQRVLDQLGLARRAGRAVFGYDAVRLALKGKVRPGLRVEASDGASDGREKLDRLAEAAFPGLTRLDRFSGEALGQTWGRDHVVHGLIMPGPEADRIETLLSQLDRLKTE